MLISEGLRVALCQERSGSTARCGMRRINQPKWSSGEKSRRSGPWEYRHGGGVAGEGARPPPLSPLYRFACNPHLTRASRSSSAPAVLKLLPSATLPAVVPRPKGRGQSWRYPHEIRAREANRRSRLSTTGASDVSPLTPSRSSISGQLIRHDSIFSSPLNPLAA